MIDTILFDFGDVIASFDPDYMVRNFVEDEKDRNILKSAVYQDWKELDKGNIDYEDYIQKTKALLPEYLHTNMNALFKDWYKFMPYVDGVPELIRMLRKHGYRLIILSNAPVFLGEVLDYFDITNLFEDRIISGEIKLIKPNKEIYEYAIEKFDLVPENTVFIDDRLDNINGAKACGINGIWFENDVEELKRILKEDFKVNI